MGKILILFIISFGLLYLIGSFLASTWNPMDWCLAGKIVFIILSFNIFGEILEEID